MRKQIKLLFFLFSLVGTVVTCIYYYTQQEDIAFQQGHRLFVQGKHEEAIPYYEKSVSIGNERLICLKELAYSYLWTDHPLDAIKLFSKIVEKQPNEYDIQFSLAEAYSWTKQYDQTILLLNKIIDKTDDLDVKIYLANAYIWNHQSRQAVFLLEKMVKQYPNNSTVRMLYGKALYYVGENEKASLIFEQILHEQQ